MLLIDYRQVQINVGEMPKGKRAFKSDHMSIATGQARLFGNDKEGMGGAEAGRKGKRVLTMPAGNDAQIFA